MQQLQASKLRLLWLVQCSNYSCSDFGKLGKSGPIGLDLFRIG